MKPGRKSFTANIILIFLIFNLFSVMIFTIYMQRSGQKAALELSLIHILTILDTDIKSIRGQTASMGKARFSSPRKKEAMGFAVRHTDVYKRQVKRSRVRAPYSPPILKPPDRRFFIV